MLLFRKEYLFHFNDEFEIQDDLEILRQIGMLMGIDKGECTPENLEKIKSFVPKSLEQYVIRKYCFNPILTDFF